MTRIRALPERVNFWMTCLVVDTQPLSVRETRYIAVGERVHIAAARQIPVMGWQFP